MASMVFEIRSSTNQIVHAPAQHFRTALDHLARAARRKAGVLIFLFDRLELQIIHALRGAHQRHGADQAGQLVGGVEHLLHCVLGLYVHSQTVAVAGRRMDDGLVQPRRAHDFLLLDAVLAGPALEIQIMEQSHDRPEIGLVLIAQRARKIRHDARNDLGMLYVKRLGVVVLQQRAGFVQSGNHAFRLPCS